MLRKQLIDLFASLGEPQGLDTFPKRLQAALVHDCYQLLPLPDKKNQPIELHARTVTHAHLHRHLLCIRCPDQAFYLDAIKGYMMRQNIQPLSQQTFVASLHCDEISCDIELKHPEQPSPDNFMLIALHLSATVVTDRAQIERDIDAILHAVHLSVCDFPHMRDAMRQPLARLAAAEAPGWQLLQWMLDDRYLLFGLQHGKQHYGVMRQQRVMQRIMPHLSEQLAETPPAESPGVQWLQLSAGQHFLYASNNVEIVRMSWENEARELEEIILIGHFSRSARYASASQVPELDSHWHTLASQKVLSHSAFYRRELRTLYDRMPKGLLFSVPPEQWYLPLKNIVDMTSPVQIELACFDKLPGNYATLLISIAGNRFGPNILHHMEQALQSLQLTVHGHETFGVGPVRIIMIAVSGTLPKHDILYRNISQCVIFWKDRAKQIVLNHAGELHIPSVLLELEGLPALYQEVFPPHQFYTDTLLRNKVWQDLRTHTEVRVVESYIEIRLLSPEPILLGEIVNRIHAFGFQTLQEAVVSFGEEKPVHISQLRVTSSYALKEEDCSRLAIALEHVFNDEADHDPLNELTVSAGLSIEQVSILITLRNHLVQLLPDAAPGLLTGMLNQYPNVSKVLLQLFAAIHLPAMPETAVSEQIQAFENQLENVQNLTEDRWFRAMATLVRASLRSNAFIRQITEPVVIKIDPQRLDFITHPKPYREIFVHGVHVEGIHLRGGPIARGGIRYSDRPADFRTEVLELMATQVAKNGQIIPTGAKGGFVVRNGTGADFVRQQYRTFIRSLLALTDNLQNGESTPPAGIRVADNDQGDSYLVVAADKGTAHFSDDANEESQQVGFWLSDAFASGGSNGYDHKAIGITARGAWVCAAHHLAKLNLDAYRDAIRVIGIGDMSGDVFGNGMLLNPNMQLLGAFNHRHIFLDPAPDTKSAFAERKRLFEAGGGWEKYDTRLISKGGGVFDRSSKSIRLSPEVQAALGIEDHKLSGEALIRALLQAPVDMLYNGGIGTYIKASHESHSDAHDPANIHVRVDASTLRCKLVCEGGNLGLTQQARIEYAQNDGLINTDAIDNSAGVDMSDHEVNLKILFSATSAKHDNQLKRNRILKELTDEVTEHCLNNNRYQSRALTMAVFEGRAHPPRIQRLRDTLFSTHRLDPDQDHSLLDNRLLSLRPQLSMLLGHEKNRLHDALSKSSFVTHSLFAEQLLQDYFPKRILKSWRTSLKEHPLANEIIATQAANRMVNDFGLAAVHHLQSLQDISVHDTVEALLLAEYLTDTCELRNMLWSQNMDHQRLVQLQRNLQENILTMAEELLRLCHLQDLDMRWLQQQRTLLRKFRHELSHSNSAIDHAQPWVTPIESGDLAGLEPLQASHLASMPQLTQAATALYLAMHTNKKLPQCLSAVQTCLKALPFAQIERQFRSPLWGSADAHALRREWLHRLVILKANASAQILSLPKRSLANGAELLWGKHPAWQELQQYGERRGGGSPNPEADEEHQRLQLILLATKLENLLEDD